MVNKIVNQVCKMKHLQIFKQDGIEVIPVGSEEEADYLSEQYGMRNVVYDIGGGLTNLQRSLEAGVANHGKYRNLGSPYEKECMLRRGIGIRLCKGSLQE